MILIQQTEGMCSRVGPLRQRYLKMLGDKLEDSIARMGAILALGIVNDYWYEQRESEGEE